MKNLKSALAILVALTMVMTSLVVVSASSFTDVQDSSAYAEAINLGVALNLFKGYEDSTFKPEGDITRAEFAAIVVRMLAQESQADGSKGTTKFTDVAADNWAAGYINIASNLNIVNGYGDGKFGPEDKVTYEQAVKMVVVALGYGPAVGSAGYPVGYLTIAQQNGMTTGVKGTNGVAINRGQVAQLVYNSLDVPLMEQTGFGSQIDYVVQDGSDDTYQKTLMSEKLGVVKLRAIVEEAYDINSIKKTDLVSVKISNSYNSKYDDTNYGDGDVFEDETIDINVGKTDIKNFVGSDVILYISYDENSDDEPIALYVKKYTASSDEVTIASDNFDDITKNATTGIDTVEYYETDSATNTSDFTIKDNATVYVNGYKKDNASVKTEADNCYGSVTFSLLDDKAAEDYDTVFITDYTNVVVDYVNTSIKKVVAKKGSSVVYDEDSDKYQSTLVDKNGKAVDWSTLKENDILSVKQFIGTTRTVKVCTLVQDVVTGTITETSGDMNDNKDAEFTISGNSYKVDGQIETAADLGLEDEGTFYLDIMGNIAYVDTTSAVNSNYAYVIDADTSGSIDETTQIKIFTYKGEMTTFDTAQDVKVSYVDTSVTPNEYTSKTVDSAQLVNTANAYCVKTNDFITFGVNSSGDINKIAFKDTTVTDKLDAKTFTEYATGDADYDYDNKEFKFSNSNVLVTDKTIIMLDPPVDTSGTTLLYDEDDYEIVSLSRFVDDYDDWTLVSAYDVNDDEEAGCILIKSDVDFTSGSDGVAMVISTSESKNTDGDTVDKFNVLQNGNKNDLNSISIMGSDSASYTSVPKLGSIIVPDFNGANELKDYTTIVSLNTTTKLPEYTTALTDANTSTTDKVQYYFGKVTARSSGRITIGSADVGSKQAVNPGMITIPTDANVYVYNNNGSKSSTQVYAPAERYEEFSIDDGKTYDSYNDEIDAVYALVREYDGDVVDVIFFMY